MWHLYVHKVSLGPNVGRWSTEYARVLHDALPAQIRERKSHCNDLGRSRAAMAHSARRRTSAADAGDLSTCHSRELVWESRSSFRQDSWVAVQRRPSLRAD